MGRSDSLQDDGVVQVRQVQADPAQFAVENLFEPFPDAILVTGPDGVIVGANARVAEMFGYSGAKLIGMPVESLIPERFRARHASHRKSYNSHPTVRQMGVLTSLFALRRDGTEFPVNIMLSPMQTASGPIVVSFVRDLTEHRAVQEALRRNDQQLRSIVESIRDYSIYLLDRNGHVTTWNTGGQYIQGYTAEEALGLHFSRLFTEEDIACGRPAELMRLATARGRVEGEGWRIRKDGSRFWSDSILNAIRDTTGEVTGYAEVTRDITDRKRAEESVMLQLSNALLANMDVSKLLEAISASIREVIPHDCAMLALLDPATGGLMAQFLGADERGTRRADVRLPLANSPTAEAIRTREPIVLGRIEGAPLLGRAHDT